MKDEDMDDLFKAARVPVDLSAARIQRLMGAVIARIDRMPPQRWWRAGWLAWRAWVVSGTPTGSVRRFAAVLAVAGLLGAAVGHGTEDGESAIQIADLLAGTTLFHGES